MSLEPVYEVTFLRVVKELHSIQVNANSEEEAIKKAKHVIEGDEVPYTYCDTEGWEDVAFEAEKSQTG